MKRPFKDWAKNCSPECKNGYQSLQRQVKAKETKIDKNCANCGKIFRVGLKLKDKKFCSPICQVTSRYGDRPERFIEGRRRVQEIVDNPFARERIGFRLKSICFKFNCHELKEEILQDWYLSMMNGQKKKLLLSAMDTLERHLWHGFTNIGRNKVTFDQLYYENGQPKY